MEDVDLGSGTNDYYVVSTNSGIPKPTEERMASSINRNSGSPDSRRTGHNPANVRNNPEKPGYDNGSFVYSNENIPRNFDSKPKPRTEYNYNETETDSKSHCCSRKRAIIIIVVVVIITLLVAAVIALSILYATGYWQKDPSQKVEESSVETGRQTFYGQVALSWTWHDNMTDVDSSHFQTAEESFKKQVDMLYTKYSDVKDLYVGVNVTRLSEGSVVVSFKIVFKILEVRRGDTIFDRKVEVEVVETQFKTFVNKTTLPFISGTMYIQDQHTNSSNSTTPAARETTPARVTTQYQDSTTLFSKESTPESSFSSYITSTISPATPTDELCKKTELRCMGGSCISLDRICDGVKVCPQGDDEDACVRRSEDDNVVEIKHQGVWTPICLHQWNASLGDTFCRALDERSVNKTTGVKRDLRAYLIYDKDSMPGSHWLSRFQPRMTCYNSEVVALTCNPELCGRRAEGLSKPLIIGGDKSAQGDWPWMVSIQISHIQYCGGAIIHPEFILTAAHCVRGRENYWYSYNIIAGGTKWKTIQVHAKKFLVATGISHPKYNNWDHDIALLQLRTPIEYTDYIRPICLPEKDAVYDSSSLCYFAGWGRYDASVSKSSPDLKELRMQIWSEERCNGKEAWNGKVTYGLFCAGPTSPQANACKGDSGGPLVCMDQKTKRWNVIGLASFVSRGCAINKQPPVFTKVSIDVDWLKSKTQCVFKCGNGKCLYDKTLVCNRRNDCGDNTDENADCPRSVACDFDHPFLCGYEKKGWFVTNGEPLPLAMFDHTFGNGKFLSSNGESILTSIKFLLEQTHCLRFFYHTITSTSNYGRFYVTLVKFASGQQTETNIWEKQGNKDIDRWMMAAITLPAGTYQLKFYADRWRVVSLDDIALTLGFCNKQPVQGYCQGGEYGCQIESRMTCLRGAAACNLAFNCRGGDDESTCPDLKTPKLYSCNFEDSRVCGIRRKSSNLVNSWEITDGSSILTLLKKDHTLNTAAGHALYTTPAEGSEFYIDFLTYSLPYCVSLYYKLLSQKSSLWIRLEKISRNVTKLAEIIDKGRRDQVWNKAMLEVPAGVTLTRLVVSVDRFHVDTTRNSFFAVDDIQVIPGRCPAFKCEAGSFQCGNDSICIGSAQQCDRKLDCPGGEDEHCNCTEDEFKCSTGLCIGKDLVCDRKNDCPNGDDEKTVCDKYRSVTCSFEDRFMCGYEITYNSDYRWKRHRSSTPTPGTGPNDDHTYGNSSGHYVYVEGNDGEHFKYTTLKSSPFKTSASSASLTFYFHLRGDPKDAGYLQVSWTGTRPSDTPLMLWAPQKLKTLMGDEWQKKCIDLRANTEMTVSWMAMRGSGSKADLAIDDIMVSSSPCPKLPCPSGRRACINGDCVLSNQFCDGKYQCRDKSDEANCSNTTVAPVCTSPNHACSTGECLPATLKCNARIDCLSGDDEGIHCVTCNDTRDFRCDSGQCIDRASRCDGIQDCIDYSDEKNCNCTNGFLCQSGHCVHRFAKCNYVIDCFDLSDELQCACKWPYRKCANTLCVLASNWCNGVDDCYDNSDEDQCIDHKCRSGQHKCHRGRCVPGEWVCDGHRDCPNGDDESNCGQCSGFHCGGRDCISGMEICDGTPQCPLKNDEAYCVTLTGSMSPRSGVVQVNRQGRIQTVCADHWTSQLAYDACRHAGYGKVLKWGEEKVTNVKDFYVLPPLNNATDRRPFNLAANVTSGTCHSKSAVIVYCMKKGCGIKNIQSNKISAFVAGGDLTKNTWPWVAAILRLGIAICGGSLIGPDWVITAAHCVEETLPFYYSVLLGSSKLSGDSPGALRLKVSRIIRHPGYRKAGSSHDIALLQLSSSTATVGHLMPVCLPEVDRVFSTKKTCFVAGWGLISEFSRTPRHLREAKLKLWDEKRCRKSSSIEHVLCTGYNTSVQSACLGDSGGPIMCLDPHNSWTQAGVVTAGPARCGTVGYPTLFIRLSSYVHWIHNVTAGSL